jgi:PAS domain S-box-containing protein
MLVAGPSISQPPRRAQHEPHRVVVSAGLLFLCVGGRCAQLVLLLVALGLLASGGSAMAQESRKTILMLLPDQPGLPLATLGLIGLRSTLVTTWGSQVSIYAEHVDLERFPGTDHEQRLRASFQAKYAGLKLDGIVAFGPTPLRFLIRWGGDLWPGVPAVATAIDELFLGNLALPENVASIPMRYDVEGTVRLALRLLPDTRRVALISGVTPMNRLFGDLHRQRLRAFGDRLELIDLEGLTLEEVLKRLAELPADTIILASSFAVDGAGRSFFGLEILPRMSAAANRPMFAVYGTALGAGVVGGSMVDFRELGAEAARALVRIVRGEAVTTGGADVAGNRLLVDWRQLRRWRLDERRLPPGTQVLYREPTLWERYRWQIVATLGLLASLTLVVVALLVERRHRQRARVALEDRLRFETLLTEISAGFAAPLGGVLREPDRRPRPANSVDDLVREGLRRIAQGLGAEGASLWRLSTTGASLAVSWLQEGLSSPPAEISLDDYPFLRTRVMRGETLRFRSLDDLPSDASVDRQSFARYGVRSFVAVPLEVAGAEPRMTSCLTLRNGNTWPDDVVQRLRTVGEIFAGALARAHAEAALSESEARFRSMADAAPVLIWMAGLDKGCTFVNEGWLDFTGRPMAKELGSGWVEGVHADDVDRCLDTYASAFDLRQPFSMEYRLRRHDGQYRTIVDKGVPRFAPDGTFLGYIGCADDITERKRGEELPRQVLDAAPNAMIMVNQDGRITLVNAAVETVFGYAREELIGSAIEILVPERVRPHHPGDRTQYFADPRVRMMGAGRELYGRRKDGSAVPLEIGLTPIQTPEGLFVLASVIDITARKAAELEAERHRGELAHVARISTMGQLATSLAHELNQPLTAILANAQTVQEWLARPSPDLAEIRETVDDIVTEAMRASEVIRRMRGLLKKGELRSDAVDFNEVVREVTRLIANAALLRGASIEPDLSPALPRVRGDAVQFQQVLLNLLVNGLHAVAEQPPPRRRVIVRTASRDGGVEVCVQDTGKGIAESDLQQIFALFYSTKGEGLGVGLSISRSIVEAYGGRIWAENDPDGGAIFRIRLPAGPTAAGPPGPAADLPG